MVVTELNLSKKDRICRRIIEYGILGLLVFSPLPAASVNEWSILIIQLTVLVMFAAYIIMMEKPHINSYLQRSLKWPKVLFLGFLIFILFQLIPFPKFLIKLISPHTHSFQSIFFSNFSDVKYLSVSLIPAHTLREGLEVLVYVLLGFLIIKTIVDRDQIRRIIYVLVCMGVFQALYGLFELYNSNPRILFYKKVYGLDSVSGTFVNRNHFSGYLEMIIPLTLGLIIARIDIFSVAGLNWQEKFLRFSEKRVSTNLFLILGVVVMSLGIVFSKSRSGIFILVFCFILFFGLTFLFFERSRSNKKWTRHLLTAIFLIIVLISLQIGISASLERFAMDRLLREGRPAYWANTLDIFAKSPLFGVGLGTFASIYPDEEVGDDPIRLYHVHNDYLEYLAELGLIGFFFLLAGLLSVVVISFMAWRSRNYSESIGLALGGIVGIFCILIHSIADFNLHIPANMLLFSVVLSMTLVTAFYRKGESDNNIPKTNEVKDRIREFVIVQSDEPS